uniref:Receptor-like serine/threonine-protein kinase n=1 Tax=Nelumbo nucifera TaxID=4432 RepID=A0A822YCY1_NELNU|nr:TPA_asm: hypothetical protein HUJ06_031451 [Nelumbo nucifera]
MASSALNLLFFMLPFSLLFISATAQTNMTLGSSLSTADGSGWRSPSGEFAFGFRLVGDTNLFLLAIWFDKIPERTIIWYANGDNPVPQGSKVQLTKDGRLEIIDPKGQQIWKAVLPSSSAGIAHGAMLDTGNFVLVSSGNSGYAWESFDNPSDTLLPTQKLEVNGMLSCRQGTSFNRGKFQLRLLPDGNLVLNTIGLPTTAAYDAYYISGTFERDPMDSGYRLVFNESGYMYILKRNGNTVMLNPESVPPSISDNYHRATLDYDGVFVQYYRPRNGSGSWKSLWIIPDNICLTTPNKLGSGPCGYNSYCRLHEGRPVCYCPPQYSLVDSSNSFSGCQPNFLPDCVLGHGPGNPEDQFRFEVMSFVNWPLGDYERLDPFTQEECEESCLHDCHCAVAIFDYQSCWKKKLPLSNGRFDSNEIGKALIKVRVGDPPLPQGPSLPAPEAKKKDVNKTLILVGSLLLGGSVFVNFLFMGAGIILAVLYTNRNKQRKVPSETSVLETNLHSFTYKDLEEATDGFKEELGRGAFGIVYKGVLGTNPINSVAVKKLDKVVQEGEKEFKTEVSVIGRTHHKNLVRLLGFCMEGQHRLLVYEFMSNGTLASFLFGISKPDWNQRVQIAFGIARGLMYLHEECSTQIIHCDIKPQNILLDDYYTARISDFGLAKLMMTNQSRTRTTIRGTKGYVAPEWFRSMPITVKVDVYSYGVMLLEIICCRKSVELEMGSEEEAILTDWAYDCYQHGRLDALVENDTDAMNDMIRLERLVKVAIWCIHEEPSLRPTMKKVTQMLEGITEVSIPPCPFPFSSAC